MCIGSDDTLQVHLELLELTGGRAPDGTTDSRKGEPGGALYIPEASHSLTLDGCIVSDNRAGNGFGTAWETEGGDGGSGGTEIINSLLAFNCVPTLY